MPFQKGKSGNPNGAPPKNRALTKILETAGDIKIEHNGKQVTRKQALAQMIWEISTTGKAQLPDGKTLEVAPQDWFGIVKFLYTHIDGVAKAELDVTSDGEKLAMPIVFLPTVEDDVSNDS